MIIFNVCMFRPCFKVHHSNKHFFKNDFEVYLCQLFSRFLITVKLFTNKQRDIQILLNAIFKRQCLIRKS